MLLLSYLDKFGLSPMVEAGQALAVLYSEARLYKGPSLAGPSRSCSLFLPSSNECKSLFNTRAFYCSERIFIVTNPLLCYRI